MEATNEILTNGIEVAEEIVSEGFKMGKGTKIGLLIGGASLVGLGIYKAVKFLKNKNESEEVEDTTAENDEDFDAEVE